MRKQPVPTKICRSALAFSSVIFLVARFSVCQKIRPSAACLSTARAARAAPPKSRPPSSAERRPCCSALVRPSVACAAPSERHSPWPARAPPEPLTLLSPSVARQRCSTLVRLSAARPAPPERPRAVGLLPLLARAVWEVPHLFVLDLVTSYDIFSVSIAREGAMGQPPSVVRAHSRTHHCSLASSPHP
jgi:hypothetical protein